MKNISWAQITFLGVGIARAGASEETLGTALVLACTVLPIPALAISLFQACRGKRNNEEEEEQARVDAEMAPENAQSNP